MWKNLKIVLKVLYILTDTLYKNKNKGSDFMYYTVTDIAKILGMSVSLIKLRAKEGKLVHCKREGNRDTKYYTKDEIIRFANECGYEIDEFAFYTREELIEMIRKMRE